MPYIIKPLGCEPSPVQRHSCRFRNELITKPNDENNYGGAVNKLKRCSI